MAYDFETSRRRSGIGALKWDMMERAVGPVPDDLVPFSVADMEFRTAPCIVDALREAAGFATYGYTGPSPRYLEAVCAWFRTRHGWDIRPEWLIQTYGVVAAMTYVLYACTEAGDGVVYQPPVYGPFLQSIRSTGRTPVPNPLRCENGRYEMDFDHLEEVCARPDVALFMLCSPHNPVGRVWTRSELERAADICLRHNVLIFSDEIHCDFVYAPHVHIPMAALSPEVASRCVVSTAASKTFNLAGLATSNTVVSDGPLRERVRACAGHYGGHFNNFFGLAATAAAYEGGAPWLEELKEVVLGNYEYCRQFLAEKFPSVTVSPLEGTYLLWADFRSLGLDDAGLTEFMTRRAGLNLNDGSIFGAEGSGFQRVVLACPRRYLEAAMARLDRAAAEAGLPR